MKRNEGSETLEKLDDDTNVSESFENQNEEFVDQRSPLLHLKPKLERQIGTEREIEVQPRDHPSQETEGFNGSIQHVFYCDFCSTAFISQEYAEEHINQYHKIMKNCQNFISDHCL